MKKYNMVFIFNQMDEDAELKVLDDLLDSMNADVFHYVANGTLSFNVDILGKENKKIEMKKHTIVKDKFFAYSITLDPMDYVKKPSRTNRNRLKRKMKKLTDKICRKTDCKIAFVDDNMSKLNSKEGIYLEELDC